MKKLRKYRATCIIAALAIITIVLPAFAGGNKSKVAKVAYDFPPTMSPAVREAFSKECDKGQALYNLTCARCHNQLVDGVLLIPDWTGAQLAGYELRVLNPNHEAGIPEEQVSAEELGFIMTFLTYKNKNAK